jgi:hypothetical protein
MRTNGYTGQLIGPFNANEELYDLIVAAAAQPIDYVSHIGIQTDVRNYIYINGKEYEIGKTGIYEIGNTEITSIYFAQDTDANSIIDYTIKISEEDNL